MKYCSSQLLNVSSRFKSTQVDMPLSSQVKSSQMCSSRPPLTWGHFSLKSGHVSVPQRLAGLGNHRGEKAVKERATFLNKGHTMLFAPSFHHK